MIRRKVIDKIGGLTKFMVGAEDYEYVARAIVQGFNVQNLRPVLYYYVRQHQEQPFKRILCLRSQPYVMCKEEGAMKKRTFSILATGRLLPIMVMI